MDFKWITILIKFSLLIVFFGITKVAAAPIISPIGPQSIFEEGRLEIYFSAVGEGLVFESNDMPSFVQLIVDDNFNGRFVVDASHEDIGKHRFSLIVHNTSGRSLKEIELEIEAIPNDYPVYYCDPLNGSVNNNGTKESPFGSLGKLFASYPLFKEGAVIFCKDGYHGYPQIFGNNTNKVYILPLAGHHPTFWKISFGNSRNWEISGLDISPENNNTTKKEDYLKIGRGASQITIQNCKIYSINDASVWTENLDWYLHAGNGINHFGNTCIVRNNYIKNTYFSVTIQGVNNAFVYNTVDIFGGDAIRAIADNIEVSYNVIKNAVVDDYYLPGGNHDDAFQSWTTDKPIRNISLIGNQIFNYVDTSMILLSTVMQGIVDFDGFADRWIIENNLVVLDHPHGIAMYGLSNSKIVNNTVIRNPYELFYFNANPWIRVNPHKDGRKSYANLMRNNVAASIYFIDNPGTIDNNWKNNNYTQIFNDYDHWGFGLRPSTLATDNGNPMDAPLIDNNQFVRTDSVVDLSCFERNATLRDFEAPKVIDSVEIVYFTSSEVLLSWKRAKDNDKVAYYNIWNDEKFMTVDTLFLLSNLDASTEYNIFISSVDRAGNESIAKKIMFTTLRREEEYVLKVGLLEMDNQIRSNNKLTWVGLQNHNIGTVNSNFDAVAIYPFLLPHIPEGKEIKSVDFINYYRKQQNSPQGSIDVYLLDARSTAQVKGIDYWQGNFTDTSAHAIPIANNYISNETRFGAVHLDEDQAKKLAKAINSTRDTMQDNPFLFLRMNIDQARGDSNGYYTCVSADNRHAKYRPYLSFTIGDKMPVAIKDDIDNIAIQLFPNPVRRNQQFEIEWDIKINAVQSMKIINEFGQIVSEKRNLNRQNSIRFSLTEVGIYFISLELANHQSITKKMVVF